ncbi:MAG: hypothetical protein LBK95_19590 [Bifidobacteriaceae bacterium]|nr:hypothetical protein [Bifidobacteriaceae bacterium]
MSGCSGDGSEDSVLVTSAMIRDDAKELETSGYAEQAAMLENGVITAAEYQQAFDSLRKCVEGNDMVIRGPWADPLDGFSLDFTTSPAGGDDAEFEPDDPRFEISDECENRYWFPLSVDYERSRSGQMDPVLRDGIGQCMGRLGFEMSGDEVTVQDFVGEQGIVDGKPTERANAATECINGELARLYPERAVVGGFGFG